MDAFVYFAPELAGGGYPPYAFVYFAPELAGGGYPPYAFATFHGRS
jgi:hypothetical protein